MPVNSPSDNAVDANESSLAWGTSAFEPGYDVGLVSPRTVGVIERDNPSTRERLWSLVVDDAPLDDVLDELSSTGLKALPDFGIAQVEGDSVRVVARGRTMIIAELSSGESHEIDPTGVRTWIEEVVSDVVAITISLSPLDDDPEVPLSSEAFAVLAGSIPARSVTRRFDVEDVHADQARSSWTAGAAEAAASAPVEADPEPVLDAAPEVELEMVEDAADQPADGDAWFDDGSGAADPGAVPPQPASPQPPADPQPVDPQPASPQPSGPPAVGAEPVDPQPASPQPSGPPAVGAEPVDPQPASPQPSGPPEATAGGAEQLASDLVSGPPPSGPGAGGAPPEPTVVVGPDDGPARGPVSSIFDDDVVEPVVPTLPPDAGFVGIDDGAADVGVSDVPAAQVFGVLAFSNGERINVDRAVLIGRNPKVAGAVEGGLPHLMKFEGPGQGLSRTHAEVRVENGEMVLEDLQSTNGTEVQLPGQQRRRLRGGEPVVVVPGTLIDFGDELHCTVETAF